MASHRDTKAKISVYIWFIQVILLFGSLIFLIWTCLTPKDPLFTVTDVHISRLRSRNSTFSNVPRLTANASVILKLEILNPNQGLGIYYDDTYLSLHFNHSLIGYKRLHGFYQGFGRNVTWVVSVKLGKGVWRGAVRVGLKTAVRFKYKIFRTETKHHQIEMGAYVPIGSSGRQLGNMNIKLEHSYEAKLTRKD